VLGIGVDVAETGVDVTAIVGDAGTDVGSKVAAGCVGVEVGEEVEVGVSVAGEAGADVRVGTRESGTGVDVAVGEGEGESVEDGDDVVVCFSVVTVEAPP
jgi:hypothetical protein